MIAKTLCAMLAGLVLIPSQVLAQDAATTAPTAPAAPAQTVDGARRFLNLLAENGQLIFQKLDKRGWQIRYRATSIDLVQCKSNLIGNPYGYPDANTT